MTSISLRTSVVVGAIAVLAACGGDKSKADSALAADSLLNRDLQLAGQDTSAKPALTDVPKAPATKTAATKAKAPPTKAAPAPAPRPTSGEVASGTALSLRTSGDLCTNTNKAGDTYMATVADAVYGSNGATIPAGAVVSFAVSKINRSENVNDPIEMVFTPTSIAFGGKTYALEAAVTPGYRVEKIKNVPKGTTTKNVVGGAAVGAIAGQLLGKNTKATVIGAAVGGAAGAAAAAAAANYEGCIRGNTTIVLTLTSPLTVPVA
jgi:hypothetical protein